MAVTAATKTAPAATFFAIAALGWYSCVKRSTVASIAVLIISAKITKDIARNRSKISHFSNLKNNDNSRTRAVARKWSLILRWVLNA